MTVTRYEARQVTAMDAEDRRRMAEGFTNAAARFEDGDKTGERYAHIGKQIANGWGAVVFDHSIKSYASALWFDSLADAKHEAARLSA